ncbi:MAG: dTDP-4-dehydrorhamnose reductase [Pseudomonadota bacterium]|jgi:dTDP-4-dehydrorhamnose reductase
MRILVTGGSGLVGRALVAGAAARGWETHAPSHAALDVCACDPARVLATHRPDALVFCAAHTALDALGEHHRALLVDAPARWAAACHAAGVPAWFLSTNFVFHDGGPHAPESPRDPRGPYAIAKRDMEDAVLAGHGRVIRTGWVIGPGGRTFGSTAAAALLRGETLRAVDDVPVQPTWSAHLADAVLALPKSPVTHAVGGETTTWYAWARAVADRLDVSWGGGSAPRNAPPSARVIGVRQDDLGLPSTRPRDARLSPAALPGWTCWVDAVTGGVAGGCPPAPTA